MKTFKINRKSWHYKVVNFDRGYGEYDPRDLCSYRIRFVSKLLRMAGYAGLVAGVATMLSVCIVGVGSLFLNGMAAGDAENVPLFTWANSLVGFLFWATVIASIIWLQKNRGKVSRLFRRKPRYDRQPNILVASYQSWKEKFCMKIEYHDGNPQ